MLFYVNTELNVHVLVIFPGIQKFIFYTELYKLYQRETFLGQKLVFYCVNRAEISLCEPTSQSSK